MENNTTLGSGPNATQAGSPNRTAAQQTNGTAPDEARRQTMQRAEELADRLGERVGHYTTLLGHSILKWVARAREEAEDVWAEAQAIRERKRAANDQSDGAPPVK